MPDQVVVEVEHQHRLLMRWLSSPVEAAVLEELRAAHTADFSMVTVTGQVLDRAGALDGLARAGNRHPGLHILINDVVVVAELDTDLLVRFLETHVERGHTSSRRVSALLRRDDAAPRGLRWHYLHETAIP